MSKIPFLKQKQSCIFFLFTLFENAEQYVDNEIRIDFQPIADTYSGANDKNNHKIRKTCLQWVFHE